MPERRFPFLVLQGARSSVTTSPLWRSRRRVPRFEGSASEARADFHWVSLCHLGTCIKILKAAGLTGRDGRPGKHVKIFSASCPNRALLSVLTRLKAEYRCADLAVAVSCARGSSCSLDDFLHPLSRVPAR